MGIMISDPDNVLATSRRDSVEFTDEKRRGRTMQPNSRRGTSYSSPSVLPIPLKEVTECCAKTRGEIEAGVCVGITRFQQEYLGKGPQDIRAHLIADLVLVRLIGVLTPAERKLVTSRNNLKGRELVKQVRTQLIETARPVMQDMIEHVTGVQMVSLHHDLSTATDEEVIVFTLSTAPDFRETIKKGN